MSTQTSLTTSWHMTTAPYAHQTAAVDKLRRLRVGGLFADMGTGKSRMAIELVQCRQHKISRCVWCCPVSLMETARREILHHTTCTDADIYTFGPKTAEDNLPAVRWYIVGLESIGSSARTVHALDALVDERTFIVVDESTYIKGHKAKRSLRIGVLGARCAYRLILTGTPITQGVEDLYTQMAFLSPKILGYRSWYSFAHTHLEYDTKGRISRRTGISEITRKISPYVYQIRKDECLDLPSKSYQSATCSLTQEQKHLYEALKIRFFEAVYDIDPADTGIEVYRLFSGLHAVACGLCPPGFEGPRLLENRRVSALVERLRQSSARHLVVWCTYVDNLLHIANIMREELFSATVYPIHGDVKSTGRTLALDQWRTDGGILLATPGVGGHGLTLTECHTVIFFSNSWKYSERIQAEDRCHRIGQTRNVHYIDIVANCGIDARIVKALSRKENALNHLREEIKQTQDSKKKLRALVKGL